MHLTAEERKRSCSASSFEDVQLFVGCLPETVTEADIRPIFEVYGNVVDVEVVRDSITGQSLGYAFVRYDSSNADASCESAVNHLHGCFFCGDMLLPMQVRLLPSSPSPAKLFLAGFPSQFFLDPSLPIPSDGVAPRLARHLAMQYGPVIDVHVISKNPNYNLQANSVAAFATFQFRSSAEQFIQDACMHVLYLPDGEFAEATVKASFALSPDVDGNHSTHNNHAVQSGNGAAVYLSQKQRVLRMATPLPVSVELSPVKLFVGCLPYSKTASEVASVFGQFGPLMEVAVLTDVDGRSKGAAFVTFACKENADEALSTLAGFVFPGSTRPINVSLAHRQQSPLAAPSCYIPASSCGGSSCLYPFYYPHPVHIIRDQQFPTPDDSPLE
jgi:RNA recognition motif-containing protein